MFSEQGKAGDGGAKEEDGRGGGGEGRETDCQTVLEPQLSKGKVNQPTHNTPTTLRVSLSGTCLQVGSRKPTLGDCL